MSTQEILQSLIAAIRNDLSSGKIAASGGSKYLAAAAFTDEGFTSIYIREDSTTITALSGKDAGGTTVDFLAFFGISGVSLKAGELYIVPNGCKITSGTLSAGTAIGYR